MPSSSQLTQILSHEPIYGRPAGRGLVAHALPLGVVGVGLGWLAWRMRRGARRGLDTTSTRAPGSENGASLDGSAPTGTGERVPSYAAAMTTSGAKLMGVRARDVRSC